jgi:hypothetical protein
MKAPEILQVNLNSYTLGQGGKPMALVPEVARKISLPHSIHCRPNVFPYQPCYIMNNIYKYEGSDYHYYQTMLQVNISYTNQKQ